MNEQHFDELLDSVRDMERHGSKNGSVQRVRPAPF